MTRSSLPPAITVPTLPLADAPLHSRALHPLVGEPCEEVREQMAFLQPFSRGVLVTGFDTAQPLLLYADGRLTTVLDEAALRALGAPLAHAEAVTLRAQRCQRATLLWTRRTGLLIRFSHRWALPLEAVV